MGHGDCPTVTRCTHQVPDRPSNRARSNSVPLVFKVKGGGRTFGEVPCGTAVSDSNYDNISGCVEKGGEEGVGGRTPCKCLTSLGLICRLMLKTAH